MTVSSNRAKKWLWAGLAAGLLAVLLAAGAYYGAPTFLCIDTGEAKADAIVVLGGEPSFRPARAAELFRAGAAPLVLVSGDGDYREARLSLIAAGVPESAIRLEPKSRTTMQNARFSVQWLREQGLHTAVIVTSWYHSRRALKTFRHAAPELTFYSRPSYYGLKRADWRRTGISSQVRAEYVKLAGYWVRYGVWPF